MAEIAVELVQAPTEAVRRLVGELEATLSAEYPAHQRHGLALEAIFRPGIRFFLARRAGEAVGCAGVALLEGYAELKRMYVRPAMRGSGVAPALLARIEQEARLAGAALLRLETGNRQHAAMRYYRRAGFLECAAFGEYAGMPADAIATSVFMEKHL